LISSLTCSIASYMVQLLDLVSRQDADCLHQLKSYFFVSTVVCFRLKNIRLPYLKEVL